LLDSLFFYIYLCFTLDAYYFLEALSGERKKESLPKASAWIIHSIGGFSALKAIWRAGIIGIQHKIQHTH